FLTLVHLSLSFLLLPCCYQDRTNQPHLPPCREYPGLLLFVGLDCLRCVCLKFVNRRSSVQARFWSRSGIYLNHTWSLSFDENSRCWSADSRSSSLSIAPNRNRSISPFKARALGSSPRRLTTQFTSSSLIHPHKPRLKPSIWLLVRSGCSITQETKSRRCGPL